MLAGKFHRGDMEMVLLVSSDDGVRDGPARIVGTDIARQLAQSPFVAQVASPWDTPQPPPDMLSADGKSALILVALKGDENSAPRHAQALAQRLAHDRGGVTVQAGGSAMVYAQVNQQTEKDLLRMEFIAVAVSFAALVWVFGGLLAAALPVAVGGFAILGSLAVLRGVAMVTDVSIVALNVTVALGMALAIDYTLLIISRYRDERGEGRSHEDALVRTMTTAGRTVLFSAVTVGLSLVAMALFPMYFLKSFAYAGVAVVVFSALAAMVVAPTVIVLLGDRLDALNVWKLGRRLLGRPEPPPRPVAQSFWYRTAKLVTRHAIPVGLAIIVLLIALGIPFLNIKWGYPDDRVLPPSASARMVSDRIRSDFGSNSASRVTVVITDTAGLTKPDLNHYTAQLSEVSDVSAVSAPTGTFVAGELRGPPSAPTAMAAGSAYPDRGEHRAAVHQGLGEPAGSFARRGAARRHRGANDRRRTDEPRLRQWDYLAATHGVRLHRDRDTGAAVPAHRQCAATDQGGGAQHALAYSGFRRPGLDLSGRPSGRAGYHTNRHVGRQYPGADVLHRLRLVDGLRSLPAVPHPRVLAWITSTKRRQR